MMKSRTKEKLKNGLNTAAVICLGLFLICGLFTAITGVSGDKESANVFSGIAILLFVLMIFLVCVLDEFEKDRIDSAIKYLAFVFTVIDIGLLFWFKHLIETNGLVWVQNFVVGLLVAGFELLVCCFMVASALVIVCAVFKKFYDLHYWLLEKIIELAER